MPVPDEAVVEAFQLEYSIIKYDVFFYGGTLKGDAEVRLYDESNSQVASVRFYNSDSSLPKDEYKDNIIFLNSNMAAMHAILHKLDNSEEIIIHYDSAIPAATLKFS